MPGHKRLTERVTAALDRCQESQAVDFKESAAWSALKYRIIRTVMAMSNLRDGGVVIIGVSERGTTWDLSGITNDDLATYDADDIVDAVNKYASPPVEVEVVLVSYGIDAQFLAIQVPEFAESPCVCKRDDSGKSKPFAQGDIYVRPPGKAQTKRVSSAQEMSELLELAAEKRARRMIETGTRIGMVPAPAATAPFDEELGGL